jgi:Domain of unknown function (DUF4337)
MMARHSMQLSLGKSEALSAGIHRHISQPFPSSPHVPSWTWQHRGHDHGVVEFFPALNRRP